MAQSDSIRGKRSRLAFPIGLLAVILAIVGAVTVISRGVSAVRSITDDTAQKNAYAKMLRPVVMFDPDTFDDIKQASVPQLVNSAIWALLMDESSADQYDYSEGEKVGILIPQQEVEAKFILLFGTEIDLASLHSTVDMSEYDITYDAALKSYIIPITGIDSAYTPMVYDIDRQGSSVILTVGYIGNEAWVQLEDGEFSAPEPDKYMKITLRENANGSQYIAAIQSVDGQEIAQTTAVQTSAAPAETTSAVTTAAPETSAADEPSSGEDDTSGEEDSTDEEETAEEE